MKLKPKDIENPKRASGYNFVATHEKWENKSGEAGFRAQYQRTTPNWYGPLRRSALQAAQDFCDYVNGLAVAASTALKTAGHVYEVDEKDKDEEYLAALGVIRDRKAQKEGKQGYVYLIIELLPGGALVYGKVGYSTNPRKRVAELQTGNPRILHLHAMRPGTEADERKLHAKYSKDNVLQEWFEITKELLLEWDAEHIIKKPAAQSGGRPKEVKTTA